MSNYTPATNFTAKDNLITGNPSKLIKGSDIDAELSAIAAAIASKGDSANYMPLAGGTFTGNVYGVTPAAGDSSTKLATTAFVVAQAFSAALPGQTGNSGKFVTTDGSTASWADAVTPTGTQTISGKTYTAPKYTRDDDGTISGGTWAIDYANGPVIKATAGANITSITMSNWPASGTAGHLKLMLVNFGAYTITFPSWTWVKSDLTTTTTFSDLSLTLPSSGTAFVDLFSTDGGTTVYAFISRN